MLESEEKFISRKEGVELARAAGIPLTIGRVHKDSMNGVGPQPAGKYGPQFLYRPSVFMRYAIERVLKNAPEIAA